jgi:hypothetical protein
MGFLMQLFGQCGKVRFEGECYDGERFTGKTQVEMFNISKEQLEAKLKDMFYVETGKHVKSLHVTGFVEC